MLSTTGRATVLPRERDVADAGETISPVEFQKHQLGLRTRTSKRVRCGREQSVACFHFLIFPLPDLRAPVDIRPQTSHRYLHSSHLAGVIRQRQTRPGYCALLVLGQLLYTVRGHE